MKKKNRAIYDEEMNRLTVSSLSCDHTFKISRNIGFVREKDNKFVTQFHQLFICLNERGEVVAWKLTKSTSFNEIEDLLIQLKKRLFFSGNSLKLVCVDLIAVMLAASTVISSQTSLSNLICFTHVKE